ncbi:3313_t:CDS:1 [Paraglomus occultum]|uniref:3313_t:CDS:1 n=1 Tax=Paraglomus occultum TaxID=144539 RepID=A0A9N8WFS4_9GLOM|nr:3313_t:CDS:1 [Paraglomus occultum]
MTDAIEATRCEFISSILHASLAIARRQTKEEKVYISLQKDISGEDVTGRINYAIKGKEDLMCIAEGKPRNIKIGYLQNIRQWKVRTILIKIIESELQNKLLIMMNMTIFTGSLLQVLPVVALL